MTQNTGDLSVREQDEEDNDHVFDGTKLGLFVSRKKFDSEDSSVEKRPVNSSEEMFRSREKTLGMPGAWQEPIEEEAEEEPELSKLRSTEARKNSQKDKSGPNKSSKLKLNFSIWEKRDSFASKRAVKRIFMNRTNYPCNTETHSSNHVGNTTVDTSEKPPSDNSKQLPHRRKLSLMTELSKSGDLRLSFLQKQTTLDSSKNVLSDTKCLANRNKRTLNHSFAGGLADSKFLEDEVDVSDVGEYSLARPSSFSILKAQNLGIFSSEEKKLNRESISFFCDFEGSDSEAKKQKQPNKKCCKVGEKESQSYILDPKNVYFCDVKVVSDGRTTLYIRNIPNKYTQRMLLEIIDKDISGDYDFFYLPIDYKNKCNLGYAFMNFCKPSQIKDFYFRFNGKKWCHFNSDKVCNIRYGRIQGIADLMIHFKDSSVMNQQDDSLKPFVRARKEILKLIEKQKS